MKHKPYMRFLFIYIQLYMRFKIKYSNINNFFIITVLILYKKRSFLEK